MPGNHLNCIEKDLKKLWNSNSDIPFLTGISINDGAPIRGLKNCNVEFRYPITVFCGKNGSGKTTFLQLAALAFHNKDKKYRKVFSDFFKKTRYDQSNEGIDLTWFYKGKIPIKNISVHKGQKKWMHYDRRPNKKVILLPVSRTLPANEKRYNKADLLQDQDFVKLNDEYLGYATRIMKRIYSEVDNYQDVFSKCKIGDCQYSCYNMGIGERIICYLLSILQDADQQSLIVIDEIEMGLHPEALSILAEIIQIIANRKQLQIFITSHSRDFLDALPREARIVIERTGDNITLINSPTTNYAISRMSIKKTEEMVIYCEDIVAAELIKTALGKGKGRVICAQIGSKTELLKAVTYHKKNGDRRKFVVIWDGDVSDSEIYKSFEDYKLKNGDVPFKKLPGNVPPERWIINELSNENGYQVLSEFLLVDKIETQRLIEKGKSETDCHNIFYAMGQESQEGETRILDYCCKSLIKLNPNILLEIKNFIIEELNK